MKRWFAGLNFYGIDLVFEDGQGWHVFAFSTKKERDQWVADNEEWNGNIVACPLYRRNVQEIMGTTFHVDEENEVIPG